MEQYFASLSKRQTMLLLTAVTFGGANCVEAFEHLPDEESELLKHRAAALLQIPRDKRIPFLVQEIKRLVTARRRQLASVDPARLAEVLGKERSAMAEVVLRALPSQLADSVRAQVPGAPVKLQREVRPDILSIIRWKLEEAIRQAAPKGSGTFKFTDLLTLQSRELLTIADRMGARALATAIAGLPDADREAFFGALPPDQRSLAQRASDAGKTRKLTEDDSRTVLEMHSAIKDPSQGMRSAGAQRLARAALAQAPEFAARLLERNPGDFGKLLIRWMKEERNKQVRGDGGRLDIVEQMERLAQRGVIDRPMRLPPPTVKPSSPSAVMPGGRLVAPVPRPGEKRPAMLPPSPAQRPPAEKEGRRDFMAEREARKAGAASSRPAGERLPREGGPREGSREGAPRDGSPRGAPPREAPARDPRVRSTTDPSVKAVKIMRDGKQLSAAPNEKRATTSPALQEIPRRKNPPPGAPRSGILRDAGQTNASSGRGPGRGSR